MSEIDPSDLARSLGEIPLFREIQRLLSAQTGPVNWEIAGQLARAVATSGGSGASATPKDIAEIEQACRLAELRLTELTGLGPSPDVIDVKVVDRAAWADIAIRGFRPLIERLAGRLSGSRPEEGLPVISVLDALGPFLLGMQVGLLAGYLSRRVLGQYELCYPMDKPSRLVFVFPNIVAVEEELVVDPQQFRMWLALHEVTHELEFGSVSWTRPWFVGLVERFIDSAEIDSTEVMGRLGGLSDPEQLGRLMEHPEELLPMLLTPGQQSIASEIQAFMSVLEGYAEWAMDQVGMTMLSDFGRMREGMNRRRAERSSVERLLEQLLGVDLKHEQYRAGERFIGIVAEAGRIARLWEGPEYLPSLEEVNEPAKWIERLG